MESKRFGGGLLVGLLLGVMVVLVSTAAAGPSMGLFGTFSPASTFKGLTPATSYVVTAYATTYTTTISHAVYQNGNASATPPGSINTTTVVTTVTTTTYPAIALENLPASFAAQDSPSRLNNLAAQPLSTGGVVLVPVLIALLVGSIGAVLYRASLSQRKEEPAE